MHIKLINQLSLLNVIEIARLILLFSFLPALHSFESILRSYVDIMKDKDIIAL